MNHNVSFHLGFIDGLFHTPFTCAATLVLYAQHCFISALLKADFTPLMTGWSGKLQPDRQLCGLRWWPIGAGCRSIPSPKRLQSDQQLST